jgi:hypothetical protein|nr:MAG TPA: protein of unknown function (DUF5040) [Caudoviricetes sp.]
MGNYEELKAAVASVIKTNGNQEITGRVLKNTLTTLISQVGANATFAGIATPETAPGTPDQNVFYIAGQSGVYSNFDGYKLEDEIVLFLNESQSWKHVLCNIYNKDKVRKNAANDISNIIDVIGTKTNVYVNKSGEEVYTTAANRELYEIDLSRIPIGTIVKIKYKSLGSSAYGITVYNEAGEKIYQGKAGNSDIKEETFTISDNYKKLKLNFDNTFTPYFYNDNKLEIQKINDYLSGGLVDYDIELLNTGKYQLIYNVGDTANSEASPFTGYGTLKIKCSENDTFYLKLQGGNNAKAYGFTDENYKVLECSNSYEKIDGEFVAPKETYWLILNNSFTGQYSLLNPKVIRYGLSNKVNTINENLTKKIDKLEEKIISNVDVVLTPKETLDNKYLNTSGIITNTSASNRRINKYDIKRGIEYKLNYTEGNKNTVSYSIVNGEGDIIKLGDIGKDEGKNRIITIISEGDYTLTLFTANKDYIGVKSLSETEKKINNIVNEISNIDKKSTNTAGFFLPNKSILLSGASISESINGYFEHAMLDLGITEYKNLSVAGTNIFKLCNDLYSNGLNYAKGYDLLIISHVHNFDVFNLPDNIKDMTVEELENNDEFGTYITTEDYVNGAPPATLSYTTDQLYAIGYDYSIKKWISLNYNLKSEIGYDSFFGKAAQICLYTYWHDARTIYNEAIRKLAKKWNLLLIKDDENIGFSKDRVHPVTKQQYSILYTNSSKYQKLETIDGVIYGFHPDTISVENQSTYNSTKKMLLEYLPYIQKRRAAILIKTLKNAILMPI